MLGQKLQTPRKAKWRLLFHPVSPLFDMESSLFSLNENCRCHLSIIPWRPNPSYLGIGNGHIFKATCFIPLGTR